MKNIYLILPLVLMLSACKVNLELDSESDVEENGVHFSADDTGLLIVDSQQSYVMDSEDFWVSVWYPQFEMPAENVDPELHNNIDRIAQLAQSANDLDFPTTITYEAYNTEWGLEYSPFIERIEQALDENTQVFFKQHFNATLEADVSGSMQAWLDAGINRIVVAGAETDVCVMQTALGLKKMGFDVYLASDATFSTEIYDRPALQRLQQAGIKLVPTNEIIESMNGEDELVLGPIFDVGQRDELHQGDRHQMAMINLNMDDESLADAIHDNKPAIEPRLITLGLDQEFLFSSLPSFHLNEEGNSYTSLYRQNVNLISHQDIADVIADMVEMNKTQAVISGVASQVQLLDVVYQLTEAGITPIILEDALMGTETDPMYYLDDAYQLGAVPSSQKSNGYEMYVEVQLGDFTEEEQAGYWQIVDLAENVIPEVYPRLR